MVEEDRYDDEQIDPARELEEKIEEETGRDIFEHEEKQPEPPDPLEEEKKAVQRYDEEWAHGGPRPKYDDEQ